MCPSGAWPSEEAEEGESEEGSGEVSPSWGGIETKKRGV